MFNVQRSILNVEHEIIINVIAKTGGIKNGKQEI
jgi:hypothetical protein